MVPSAVVLTAPDIVHRVRIAELGRADEIEVRRVEGDGYDVLGIVGIGKAQMSRHARNKERTGVVLVRRYSGIKGYRIRIMEKRSTDLDGFRNIGTAGIC